MTSIQTRRWRPLHWRSRCHSSVAKWQTAPYLSRNEAPGHRKGTECYTKQNRKHERHKRVDMAVWHRITPDRFQTQELATSTQSTAEENMIQQQVQCSLTSVAQLWWPKCLDDLTHARAQQGRNEGEDERNQTAQALCQQQWRWL